jgi:hypothetical protein
VIRLVVLVLVVTGCGTWDLRPRGYSSSTREADATLDQARAETDAGRPKNALALYEGVARDSAGTAAAAMALHEMAILRLDPRSPIRDLRGAQQILARLAKEYPTTPWGREANAWRVLFRQAARCQEEATQLGADAERLRQTIDSLKDTDVDLEVIP